MLYNLSNRAAYDVNVPIFYFHAPMVLNEWARQDERRLQG